jgi:hypothetical protein
MPQRYGVSKATAGTRIRTVTYISTVPPPSIQAREYMTVLRVTCREHPVTDTWRHVDLTQADTFSTGRFDTPVYTGVWENPNSSS